MGKGLSDVYAGKAWEGIRRKKLLFYKVCRVFRSTTSALSLTDVHKFMIKAQILQSNPQKMFRCLTCETPHGVYIA